MTNIHTFDNPYTGLEAHSYKAGLEAGRTSQGEVDDPSDAYQAGLWQGRLERMAHQAEAANWQAGYEAGVSNRAREKGHLDRPGYEAGYVAGRKVNK